MPKIDTDIHQFQPYLFGLAYRMLGAAAEAEDIVQDAFERWYAQPDRAVAAPRAYLTQMVTRLCLDYLKSARKRREHYVGPWLPEPLLTEAQTYLSTEAASADAELIRADSISAALLIALERLSPHERAVHLLHEVFDYSHGEIGEILGKSEAACRQIQSRARKAMAAEKPRFFASDDAHKRLLDGFLTACTKGDMPGLIALFSADVTASSDGGGKVTAARQVLVGATAVARFYIGLAEKLVRGMTPKIRTVNGHPALLLCAGSVLYAVVQFNVRDEHIQHVGSVLNPDKLDHIARSLGLETVH